MKSKAAGSYWQGCEALPEPDRKQRRKAFRLRRVNPSHPPRHFEPLRRGNGSARVGEHDRAAGCFPDRQTFVGGISPREADHGF